MDAPTGSPDPGPDARRAFATGVRTAALVALAAVALAYWTGAVTPLAAGFALVVLGPVYLLVVASALSKWLGYAPDATDLRPVYRERRVRSDPGSESDAASASRPRRTADPDRNRDHDRERERERDCGGRFR